MRKCQGGSYLCLSFESDGIGSLSLTSRLPRKVPRTFRIVSRYSRVLLSVQRALHRHTHTLHCAYPVHFSHWGLSMNCWTGRPRDGVRKPPIGGAVYLNPWMFVIVPSSFVVGFLRVAGFMAAARFSPSGVWSMFWEWLLGTVLRVKLKWSWEGGLYVWGCPAGVGVVSLGLTSSDLFDFPSSSSRGPGPSVSMSIVMRLLAVVWDGPGWFFSSDSMRISSSETRGGVSLGVGRKMFVCVEMLLPVRIDFLRIFSFGPSTWLTLLFFPLGFSRGVSVLLPWLPWLFWLRLFPFFADLLVLLELLEVLDFLEDVILSLGWGVGFLLVR